MDIENSLIYLGFKEKIYSSEYFRTYQKNESTLFVFQPINTEEKHFSNASGDFTGNVNDLIIHFYLSETSSGLNEAERVKIFHEKYHLEEEIISYNKLTPIRAFNLFQIILEKGKKFEDLSFNNVIVFNSKLHFMIIDDEKTNSQFNVLGVVVYDEKTNEIDSLEFSKNEKGIYFSNPQIPAKSCVIFNNIKDMLFFKNNYDENFFYIFIPKDNITLEQIRTIMILTKSKGIDTTYLAFSNNIKGLLLDFQYISLLENIELKLKEGYLKIYIPHNEESDKLVQGIKKLDNSLIRNTKKTEKSKELLFIKNGNNLKNEASFIIEIALTSNILISVLSNMKNYYLNDRPYIFIKPKQEFWTEQRETKKEKPLKANKLLLGDIMYN